MDNMWLYWLDEKYFKGKTKFINSVRLESLPLGKMNNDVPQKRKGFQNATNGTRRAAKRSI